MKLGDYTKKVGLSYKTAWRWYQKGQINGTIIVTEGDDKASPQKVTIYSRVSAPENRPNLQSPVERLPNACIAKGWQVHKIVKEELYTVIIDRMTRFGFNYIQTLMEGQGRRYGLRRAMRTTEKITQELRPCS